MRHTILIKLFLITGFGLIYQSINSNMNGIFNGGTTCSTCHGGGSTNTTIALSGLPATYEINKTYSLTFTVTNSTNHKAGFNILVSKGTLTAGTGSVVNTSKTQITHSSPMVASGNTATFTFTWKAPATISAVTFKAAGNAVNGNNQDDAGDQWAATSMVINGMFPIGINAASTPNIRSYPNPVSDKLYVEGLSYNNAQIKIMNLKGQIMVPTYEFIGHTCVIDCKEFTKGIYFLMVNDHDQCLKSKFIKE